MKSAATTTAVVWWPLSSKGLRILDLGSGSGRDAYTLAALVGESGSVVGVDMTDEQLEIANRHLDYHAEAFGYKASNVEFKKAISKSWMNWGWKITASI